MYISVMNYKRIGIALLIGCMCVSVFGQIPGLPVMPSSPTPSMPNYSGNMYGPKDSTPHQHHSHIRNNSHSAAMDMYERDRMEVERRQQMAMQDIDEATMWYREQQLTNYLIENGFPSNLGYPGTQSFQAAYEELSNMLDGSVPMNVGKALFLTENAFYGGEMDYNDFSNEIDKRVNLCQRRMEDLKLNPNDNMALNLSIWSLLCDTLEFKGAGTENTFTHYPLEYNYEDYQSKIDYTSHFVSTLIHTNKGNCHSMPLLYLIMAEKLGAEAHLSYAPLHSFIKIQDKKGQWHNLEITNRYMLTDGHYINHNYVKAEAIRNKIYMNPLSKKEVIAAMMAQLGTYYLARHGYDPFVVECADKALEHYPVCTQSLLLKANYQTRLTLEIAGRLQAPNPDVLRERSQQAYEHYLKMLETYKQLDDTGYEETPVEIYENWVEHIEDLKRKQGDPFILKTKK